MAGKFVAYRQPDQELLFDTELISYGLRKSGYLAFVANWPQKYLRSVGLDPNFGGNWNDDAVAREPIYGITLSSWSAPIAFLVGDGSPCGEIVSGSSKTLLFTGASASTKCYVFDLMSDLGPITGLKCFRDSDQKLTFNSAQPPLNVVAAVQAPQPGQPVTPGSDIRYTAYAGGYNSFPGDEGGARYPQIKSYVDVVVGSGEFAASINFTRSAACSAPQAYLSAGLYSCQEGCSGITGGVRFMFTVAACTTREFPGGAPYNYWRQIPIDRFPVALVISTNRLPFPFN
ncbi:hypothetical protein [Pseudomonas sp. CCOS 191]|uniref:hypothetical protein n=1 Tax=Pseudomonas sp. CCOS 191 TaxID=1649877 RepID=UPI000624723A|nr:hypothetical protein [Pseudomonas sp. CCOS 191]CRI56419.1 hypothetical protein CCOS191_1883 [Pseudomonas sp. CCOS 191]